LIVEISRGMQNRVSYSVRARQKRLCGYQDSHAHFIRVESALAINRSKMAVESLD
jgi:hypothetical protein